MSDRQNAKLVAATGVAVIGVDYRLAISVPIAAQIDDCEAAALWAIDNVLALSGTSRLVVMASSADAHLAACTLLRLRHRGDVIRLIDGAVLYFGLYDFSGTAMIREAGPETLLLDAPTVRETLCLLTPTISDVTRRSRRFTPISTACRRHCSLSARKTCFSRTIAQWRPAGKRLTAIAIC